VLPFFALPVATAARLVGARFRRRARGRLDLDARVGVGGFSRPRSIDDEVVRGDVSDSRLCFCPGQGVQKTPVFAASVFIPLVPFRSNHRIPGMFRVPPAGIRKSREDRTAACSGCAGTFSVTRL